MRIDLPKVRKGPNATAHPYPMQISLQTQEFMQATLLHHAFMDIAAGQRVREPGGFAAVEKELLDGGLDPKDNEQAWSFIEKYQPIFNRFIHQNVLILLRSHWDWYIEKLGAFTIHSRAELGGPTLSNNDQRQLERLGFQSIRRQIEILEYSTGLTFNFASDTVDNAAEMSLVRNLGIHNRWETNHYYLAQTESNNAFDSGEIREFTTAELQSWHKSLIDMCNETAPRIAQLYCNASDYP